MIAQYFQALPELAQFENLNLAIKRFPFIVFTPALYN